MATRELTVTNLSRVSNVADPTTAKIAASEKTCRRNAPYAVEITPRIKNAANITTTS